jgi:D-alanyl-lipoteichoic acid acyltransferase DltB (MBOAT superfamily)
MLGFFKYMGFFTESAAALMRSIGVQVNPWSLKIILPLGISFYTFQTLSYTLDVYRGQMKASRSFLDFALFVTFFPQLVAGPIERARNLLPQVAAPRHINPRQFHEGLYLIGLGLIKKVIVADNLAGIVNAGFANYAAGGWLDTLIYLHAFAFQIYGDFSGYSDIARGTAKMLGFELMVNFDVPLMSSRIPEFWQRWHISLSTWVRDYVFKSLGRTGGRWRVQVNTLVAMTLMGLWHGANWTFVLWGFYFGLLQVLYSLYRKAWRPPRREVRWKAVLRSLGSHVLTLESFIMGALLFRSKTIADSWAMSKRLFASQTFNDETLRNLLAFSLFILPVVVEGFWQYFRGETAQDFMKKSGRARFVICLAAGAYVLYAYFFGANVKGGEEFIYFQF